ncbi:MAG: sugar ABC transporter permease, partial [Lachnospiraceae bacterium]|nr:sugar ABC transporter permease [Lachnospiraceae bacterium]
VMSVGYEKVFLLQTGTNLDVSDVISTYTYRTGILDGQTSYASAIGLFNSVVNLFLVLLTNRGAKKLTGTGLW